MQKKTSRKIFRWVKILLAIYLLIGIALYFFQEKILFHPEKLAADHVFQFDIPFREIKLPVNEEKILSIVQFTLTDSAAKGVVLYFHGNRKNIERYAQYAGHFTRNQYEVWMIDYPGFGKTTGIRTEKAFYDDAQILYRMARAKFSAEQIIIYGKSLGTGPASFLAYQQPARRLILETPYYSMESLMSHYAFIYPVGSMAKFTFPNNEYLPAVEYPVTLIHGNDDEIIPISQARKLHGVAPKGTELIDIPGGRHNNLADFPQFQRKLDSLLSR